MSLLPSLGLGELASRPRGERSLFFLLVAIGGFLFADQNLMAPNLSAIGEELVITRAEVTSRLNATDRDYARLEQRLAKLGPGAKAFAHSLAQARDAALADRPSLASDPDALEGATLARLDTVTSAQLTGLLAAAETQAKREARVSEALQREIDDRLAGRASLWFWLLGGGMALGVGYLTDRFNRKKLLVATVIVGAVPCLLTGFARTADEFVLLRALTGIGIGAVLPLTYSLVGDLFSAHSRPAGAAWIGLATGLGIAGGQLLAGLLGPSYGWRLPFILVALPNLVLAGLLGWLASEPRRGGAEPALQEALAAGGEYSEKLRLSDLKEVFANRTNLLVFFQGIPGSMPWGFFFTFLVDFYHSNKGFPVEAATLMITVFGAGAILGGFVGGLWGGRLYRKHPKYLPMLCAASIFAGILPILGMVNWTPAPPAALLNAVQLFAGGPAFAPSIALPALMGVVGAFLATMTSSNVKAVLIDVNPPERRGTLFSLFNLADDLGKGLAPFLIGSVLAVHLGRLVSFNIAVSMWLVCGVTWLLLIRQFPKDVAALEAQLTQRAQKGDRLLIGRDAA